MQVVVERVGRAAERGVHVANLLTLKEVSTMPSLPVISRLPWIGTVVSRRLSLTFSALT